MTLFGLQSPGSGEKGDNRGKHHNHDADIGLVRWIVQQQELNGCVDLNIMKQYALTIHKRNNPKFCASKTWLGNFLQRNMSVLQGTKFVQGDRTEVNVFEESARGGDGVVVKQELDNDGHMVKHNLGDSLLGADEEESYISEYGCDDNDNDNYDDDDDTVDNSHSFTSIQSRNLNEFTDSYLLNENALQGSLDSGVGQRMQGSVQTPFGKRPIIVGQSKTFNPKTERQIVKWVLERNARDGYVFTDDFKDYARSLYRGSKPFGATQCWMKKFLRRNRALKDVKFCSKYKNMYTTEDKQTSVALAKRFGVGYAAKKTGIKQKIIHSWKLSAEKGLLNLDPVLPEIPDNLLPSACPSGVDSPSTSTNSVSPSSALSSLSKGQACHGIVPEFEDRIVAEIKALQATEGSVNYNDISKISQSVYKETRPTFKAAYGWIKSFLERRKEDLVGIELENVSKVLVEEQPVSEISREQVSSMVDEALKAINQHEEFEHPNVIGEISIGQSKRPIVVGPSVMFDRKTEKKLVEWALEEQEKNGYVFTDDFKVFAKSVHTGPKHFSASSGWMSLFLRRHRELKHVKFKSKFKNNYTEEEKEAAVLEAKRFGTGHVGRKLGIDPALICAWRIKMERNAPKQQTFWKGTKLKKFGKHVPKFKPMMNRQAEASFSDAARGVVPEFEQKIIDLIHEEHEKEGSISYEEISRIAQSIYCETRPSFKASYAWIRNFMKRSEGKLDGLNIDNVKKVFMPEDDDASTNDVSQALSFPQDSDSHDFQLSKLLNQKRPIIVGQSRAFDTKTERKLVQWVVEQHQKNGYVFLDQFKAYAQSLYKGEKKFAATQAWRIKFLRRNHAALKQVRFTSSFRNQYTLEEKKVIVAEAKKYGVAHVSKKTGIEHTLINQWKIKLERDGIIPVDTDSTPTAVPPSPSGSLSSLSGLKKSPGGTEVGPGLFSSRGVVPAMERKIVQMVMNKMDEEGSVTYQFVSMAARMVYKETRPTFKASYNWVKDFIKRNKKGLKHADFETTGKSNVGKGNLDVDILIPEDVVPNAADYFQEDLSQSAEDPSNVADESMQSWVSQGDDDSEPEEDSMNPEIVIENAESGFESHQKQTGDGKGNAALEKISQTKRPIIIGKAKHFNRKEEKLIVEWLLETQQREGFVFTDDFRRFSRSLYKGPTGKFGATNAWITKFLRRNRMENKVTFRSKLVGNNPKFEEKIIELILEQQHKEGSVSNDDIQKITQSVYREIRPNFRACYNWIRDFIKRHKTRLAGVELENVKKVYYPDENEKDGVLIRDYDPSMNLPLMDSYRVESSRLSGAGSEMLGQDDGSQDSSWGDFDSSHDLESSRSSFTSPVAGTSTGSILDKLASQKRPVIIAPPKMLDMKTEKKLVQWMLEQQEQHGCVYLDLFKKYAKSVHTGPKHFAATQAWMIKFKQRNCEALKNVTIKSRFRNEYSMEEKIAIVEEAKRLGCNHVGRKLGINGGVIYSWKQQLEQAEKMGTQAELSDPVMEEESSRGIVPEFEMAIVNMVLETQRAKGSVSNDDISMCARSVYKETRPNFKASYNWVMDFVRKYKEQFKDVVFENKKRVLTEEEKLHILSEEKKYGTEHVTKKRNIAPSTLSNWRKQMRERSIPIPKFKAIVSKKIKKKYAKTKLKTYTKEEKRKMVAVCEQKGITYASLKLGVSRTMLTKWIRLFRDEGENIIINFTHASTLKKSLEQQVVEWIIEENEKLGIVLTSRVMQHAQKVFEESYTNYNATTSWLESFLSANRQKLEKIRFREEGDKDLEFSEDIRLKVARYAEKNGGSTTADLTGLLPKTIYSWRAKFRSKGLDLTANVRGGASPHAVSVKTEAEADSSEPKSLMQQKLDRVAAKFDAQSRREIVDEAGIYGTMATAAKHKIPLPLLLRWMKTAVSGDDSSQHEEPSTPTEKLTVKFPMREKSNIGKNTKKIADDLRQKALADSKEIGIQAACNKYGIGKSTLYTWSKEERESSTESLREAVERRRSMSSGRTSFDRESANTPVRVQNIKKEPGTTEADSETTPGSYYYEKTTQSGTKVVRKYSEQQKIDAAKRALEIGPREAASELNIPPTNVIRWREMYKSKALRQMRQEGRSPKQGNSSPASSTGITSSGSLKRKAEDIQLRSPPTVGYKKFKLTDEDRIALVKESEKGQYSIQEVAARANVSLDSLYKWRSKYLPGIRLAAATEQESTPERDFPPAMPAPRNKFTMLFSGDAGAPANNHDEIDGFENIVAGLTDDDLAHIEANTSIPADKSQHAIQIGISSGNQSSKDALDITQNQSQSTNFTNPSNTSSSSSPGVEVMADFDMMAVDQLAKMTSSYMETELEREQVMEGANPQTAGSFGEPDNHSDMQNGSQKGDVNKVGELEPSSLLETQNQDSGHSGVGCIKITNVKSEARS